MFTELLNNVNIDIGRGTAQAIGAIVLCLAVVGLCRRVWGRCRRFGVHVEREGAISIARGLAQMVFVGIVLAALLHGSLLVGAVILLAMTFNAPVALLLDEPTSALDEASSRAIEELLLD